MKAHHDDLFARLTRNVPHEHREPLTVEQLRDQFDVICDLAYRLATVTNKPSDDGFAGVVREKIEGLQYLLRLFCCHRHSSAIALRLICGAAPEVDEAQVAQEQRVQFGRALCGVGG